MDKFEKIRSIGTSAPNYELSNDDIIARLKSWDTKFGITVSDISPESVTVTFTVLPSSLQELSAEIYEFCPDIVDQHFGCFGEIMEIAEEIGQEIEPELLALMEGVDLDSDDAGLELLARSLKQTRTIALWWD
jgi:hypothetical protein